jgi:hypothetical protein
MCQVPIWFERKFEFLFPVELLPNLCARLRGTPARLEEVLHGRSHTILIAVAPIYIPVAKTRIPAAPVTCERICGST